MSKIKNRLSALHSQLLAAHSGSAGLTTPTLGREREDFIDIFLKNCIPQGFRFGTGQAIDANENESNQLDIVIESTVAPSIPLLGSSYVRLYPIESICAVIEVKSNISQKWNEVIENYRSVECLESSLAGGMGMEDGRLRSEDVAYFAVGYEGWVRSETFAEKWLEAGDKFDCILQLEPLMIVHKKEENTEAEVVEGPLALLRFLELLVNAVQRNQNRYDLSNYFD